MIYKMIYVNHIMNLEEKDFKEKIQIVLRQTNYTQDIAIEKLALHDNDEIKCIKDYLGITEKKAPPKKISSLNQQIYQEIRHKLK